MLTPGFEKIMQEMEQLVASKRIAIMCAEAVPWRCHRQLLADAFLVRGFSVRHIMDDGCYEHQVCRRSRFQMGQRSSIPLLLSSSSQNSDSPLTSANQEQ